MSITYACHWNSLSVCPHQILKTSTTWYQMKSSPCTSGPTRKVLVKIQMSSDLPWHKNKIFQLLTWKLQNQISPWVSAQPSSVLLALAKHTQHTQLLSTTKLAWKSVQQCSALLAWPQFLSFKYQMWAILTFGLCILDPLMKVKIGFKGLI